MLITIDTEKALSVEDRDLLRQVIGDTPQAPSAPAPAPAKKAAAKKAAAPPPEPEPEPEPEEDLLGEGPTLDDAIAAAKKLVQGGKSAKVKEALGVVGVARVGELTDDKIQTFLDALGS